MADTNNKQPSLKDVATKIAMDFLRSHPRSPWADIQDEIRDFDKHWGKTGFDRADVENYNISNALNGLRAKELVLKEGKHGSSVYFLNPEKTTTKEPESPNSEKTNELSITSLEEYTKAMLSLQEKFGGKLSKEQIAQKQRKFEEINQKWANFQSEEALRLEKEAEEREKKAKKREEMKDGNYSLMQALSDIPGTIEEIEEIAQLDETNNPILQATLRSLSLGNYLEAYRYVDACFMVAESEKEFTAVYDSAEILDAQFTSDLWSYGFKDYMGKGKETIKAIAERMNRGIPACIMLAGEPGTGKSFLGEVLMKILGLTPGKDAFTIAPSRSDEAMDFQVSDGFRNNATIKLAGDIAQFVHLAATQGLTLLQIEEIKEIDDSLKALNTIFQELTLWLKEKPTVKELMEGTYKPEVWNRKVVSPVESAIILSSLNPDGLPLGVDPSDSVATRWRWIRFPIPTQDQIADYLRAKFKISLRNNRELGFSERGAWALASAFREVWAKLPESTTKASIPCMRQLGELAWDILGKRWKFKLGDLVDKNVTTFAQNRTSEHDSEEMSLISKHVKEFFERFFSPDCYEQEINQLVISERKEDGDVINSPLIEISEK